MADQKFENPCLVAVYDAFDGQRTDLVHYVALAKELKARSVLDVGCGTGCFANLLAARGIEVIGLDPARASLDIARRKSHANLVWWILGDATNIPPMTVDLVTMTGNVAQVFLADDTWEQTLLSIYHALSPNGYLVFEVRDPAKKAWIDWTKEKTYRALSIPDVGMVESWCNVMEVADELVSFRWTYVFQTDGEILTSDSTLRFRGRGSIEQSLLKTGYLLHEVRDAPDRPGKEFVFIARRNAR